MSNSDGLGKLNSGNFVAVPSAGTLKQITDQLERGDIVSQYGFPDQDLLSDVFCGRWVPLPYVYNALKTLRYEKVHAPIWRDDSVKCVHIILYPKAWDEEEGKETDETHKWWRKLHNERLADEKARGIDDGW